MSVCQRNVAHFVHMECRSDKINDIFQDLGSLVSLRLQKDGGAKSKQIWLMGTYRTETQAAQALVVRSYYFFNLDANVQLVKRDIVTAIIYTTTKFHYAKHDSHLSAYGGVGMEVSYFYYKNIKTSAKISNKLFFPIHNTSIH